MVTDAASRVSVFPAIRAWMVRLQQEMGAAGGVVMEGRDIGTVVFPACGRENLSRRGTRSARHAPLRSAGPAAEQSQPEEVIRELHARDERDRNRADSPLKAGVRMRSFWTRRICLWRRL